jgi:hypothetical protein
MKSALHHLICRREKVLVLRHFGHHSAREALANFISVMQSHPPAATFPQLIDTRNWFGSIYDDDLADLTDWMNAFRREHV